MSELFQEQVSLFVDDELSAEECEFFVRRLQRDPDSRSQLVRYQMIGAAIRGELNHPHADVLRRRLHFALHGVSPSPEVPVGRPSRVRPFVKPAIGFAVAAGVAVVALVGLRSAGIGGGSASGPAAVGELQALEDIEVPTYTVPREPVERRLVSPPIRLTNYLMHHVEYAAPLTRTSFHSNVVAPGDAEIAEDEEQPVQ